jgi:hypothetical protein
VAAVVDRCYTAATRLIAATSVFAAASTEGSPFRLVDRVKRATGIEPTWPAGRLRPWKTAPAALSEPSIRGHGQITSGCEGRLSGLIWFVSGVVVRNLR